MSFLIYLAAGIVGGIIGGMGMGGGTLLIPILTVFLSVPQHTAQAANLIAFIPMAALSLVVHTKNKLTRTQGSLWLIIFALLFSVVGSMLAKSLDAPTLKKLFGAFLIILSFFLVRTEIRKNQD